MKKRSLGDVRVDTLLRAFAGQLLKARSDTAIARALDRVAHAFGLAVACIVPVEQVDQKPGRLPFFGRGPKGREHALVGLLPLRAHPLFAGTMPESGAVLGTQIRKKSALTPAAWQRKLPDALKGRETLSFIVRYDDRARWHDAWFVLVSVRTAKLSGLARSVTLVAAHLAYDRSRAMTHEKCGRMPAARRANEAQRLMASGASDIDLGRLTQRRAARRDGPTNGIH